MASISYQSANKLAHSKEALGDEVSKELENSQALIAAWETNNRVTMYLIENLPAELWTMNVPGSPGRTVGTIAAHLHNARCMWIKMIGGTSRR